MATKIVTKNSSTGGAVPSASDLVQGELAVNVADKRLFTEDNGGSIVELGTNPSTIDINAGSIDGTAIGASSASTGAFTTLTATGLTVDTDTLYVDSTNNRVGIGTTSPDANLVVYETATSGTDHFAQRWRTQSGGVLSIACSDLSLANPTWQIRSGSSEPIAFNQASHERMRIDASGNVGIGTTSPTYSLDVRGEAGLELYNASGGGDVLNFRPSLGDANKYNMSISSYDHSGGGVGPADGISINAFDGVSVATGSSTARQERMRIDSSGNLLVGKTALDGTGSRGLELRADGLILASKAGQPMSLDRTGSDGVISGFYKDGAIVGSIGTKSGDLYIGTGDTALRFQDADDYIYPVSTATGTSRDNAIDLGWSSGRFDDIYATNGTIQTSDRNEKQDIAELSEAEQRVAVACKGLLRKFRWKDSVAEKGDDARIHFGIMAQDLQAAFEAEGLDAGDYAMFISTTWTDEETNEEKTRMGVRYSELLAFIISAI
jgi:hypothetical protein